MGRYIAQVAQSLQLSGFYSMRCFSSVKTISRVTVKLYLICLVHKVNIFGAFKQLGIMGVVP